MSSGFSLYQTTFAGSIHRIHICTGSQQHFDHISITCGGRLHQAGFSGIIRHIHIYTSIKQQFQA